ncbi:uncharacterized protein MONOS_16163 [Monocercomonoides exilis]|uniref:uncharacterized protein n=1 Tax=Monocercomonoides exilis TaxID=2049356 RepID=UPI0035597F27|nr:hypothetical protein MONOS_16163 [Monocercomonoides exilis]|eukprot:MONOS_16163.1-p1 / transcript=MONOS_16163.1 / gene=MONOS_16163 / organism=Monocercomonoides_exilis_PA203 / gene_product=unspecified product / transcript_product=unspecified product / location=Mono_scaffold01533:6792-7226(-) / protein_length=145 / sequence_SO=supercontig / SO=protein_coding / is_pseudo=false
MSTGDSEALPASPQNSHSTNELRPDTALNSTPCCQLQSAGTTKHSPSNAVLLPTLTIHSRVLLCTALNATFAFSREIDFISIPPISHSLSISLSSSTSSLDPKSMITCSSPHPTDTHGSSTFPHCLPFVPFFSSADDTTIVLCW